MRTPDKIVRINDGKSVEYLKKRKVITLISDYLQATKSALEICPNDEGLNMVYYTIKDLRDKIKSL